MHIYIYYSVYLLIHTQPIYIVDVAKFQDFLCSVAAYWNMGNTLQLHYYIVHKYNIIILLKKYYH